MKSTIFLMTALLALTANAQQKIDSSAFAKPIVNKRNVPLKTTAPISKPVATPTSKSQTYTQSKTENTQATLTDAYPLPAGFPLASLNSSMTVMLFIFQASVQ